MNLQKRVGSEDTITAKEQDHKRLLDEHMALKVLHEKVSKSLATQIELTKKEKSRLGDFESRLADANKKLDDTKQAYYKSKTERERLR